jgi:hypothetical protein
MMGHENVVTSMAVSHDRSVIATGSMGRRPEIILFDAKSLAVKQVSCCPPFVFVSLM